MPRITKKDVEKQFERFLEALGGKLATSYKDVGGFELDCNFVYGGYCINQIYNEGGAISKPFGSQRFRTSEFYEQLGFATKAFASRQPTTRPLFATANH